MPVFHKAARHPECDMVEVGKSSFGMRSLLPCDKMAGAGSGCFFGKGPNSA
jgi:hypothetical protein